MKVLVTGNVGVDVLMGTLEPWPQPGTETVVGERTLRVGGALGNTALALHALGIQADYAANVADARPDSFNGCLVAPKRRTHVHHARGAFRGV